jgi:hypothetical protein
MLIKCQNKIFRLFLIYDIDSFRLNRKIHLNSKQ